MGDRSIVILDCLEGDLADYCYGRIAGYAEPDFRVVRLEAMRGRYPESPVDWASRNAAAAMIISGSCHSPLDTDPWIAGCNSFIRGFVGTGLPVLGICFGHEALAAALGGVLDRRESLAVAFRDVRISSPDPIFKGFDGTTRQPVAHEVFVSAPPPGFEVIGASDDCPVQVMRHSELPIYGVQFHPEMDRHIKEFDPDWAPLTDEEFEETEGPVLMRNFISIVRAFG